MAKQVTPNLGLEIYPDITGVYQRELRQSYLHNFILIDEELGGTPKDVYTKEQVDAMLTLMSDLLVSSTDFAEIVSLVNILMGENNEYTSFGASIAVIDIQATEIVS